MSCIKCDEFLPSWKADLLSGKKPVFYYTGIPLGLSAGRLVVIGAPPGRGKTAFCNQIGFDALRYQKNLRLLIANVEMSPAVLLERELARVSGVSLTAIQRREFLLDKGRTEKVESGLVAIDYVADRVSFLPPPYTIRHLLRAVADCGSDMIIVDYIQRFSVGEEQADRKDTRSVLTETMSLLRQIADMGKAVIVVSAVARDKATGKQAYSNLTLGSFRDTSELEYGCDDAYTLEGDDMATDNRLLRHHKSRHAERIDIPLRWVGSLQRFTLPTKGGV